MTDRQQPGAYPSDPDVTLPFGQPAPQPEEAPAPHPRRGALRRAGKWVLIVLGGYYALCVLLLIVYRFVPPPVTGIRAQRRVEALLSRREYSAEHRFVRLKDLPEHVPRAVVAAEDGRFWSHYGFDWGQMWEAQGEAIGGRRLRGASTITQQLVKNLFGCACRNPLRKLFDLALTPAAELILGKHRILELYLNEVEWGRGVYGIDAGARERYDVSAGRLSRTQAAGMAALLPNPRQRTPANTRGYRQEILRRMRHRGW